jgi:murein L,D-transpeptidase YcbB/YkuD
MRRSLAFVPVLVLVAAAAGCGGSKSSSPPTTTSASTSSSSTSSVTATASTKNCSKLVALGSKVSQSLLTQSSSGITSLQSEAKAVQAAASSAPAAIKDDVETLAAAYANYATQLKKAGFKPGSTPTAAQIATFVAAIQKDTTPKLNAAIQSIEAWAKKSCNG